MIVTFEFLQKLQCRISLLPFFGHLCYRIAATRLLRFYNQILPKNAKTIWTILTSPKILKRLDLHFFVCSREFNLSLIQTFTQTPLYRRDRRYEILTTQSFVFAFQNRHIFSVSYSDMFGMEPTLVISLQINVVFGGKLSFQSKVISSFHFSSKNDVFVFCGLDGLRFDPPKS